MAKAKCEAAKAEVAKAKRLSRNENKGKGRICVSRSLLFEAPGEESVAKAKLLCGRQNHKTGRPRKD